MSNKEKKILIVDGNLFARRIFYKFQHLSSKIKFGDLETLAPNLIRILFPEAMTGKKSKKEVVDENSGEIFSISIDGRIERKISSIIKKQKMKNTEKVVETGIAYGVLKSLIHLYRSYKIDYIVFCYDPPPIIENKDRSNQYRVSVDEKYKSGRKPQDLERFLPQLAISQYILSLLKVEQAWTNKFEADDILQLYSKKVFKNRSCLILTSDHDLFQLLDEKDKILVPGKGYNIFCKEDFCEKFGISPIQWRDVMSLCGCAGDDVKGLKNIGSKEALHLIQRFGTLKSLLKNFHKDSSLKPRTIKALKEDKRKSFKTVIKTRKLISLYGLKKSLEEDLHVWKEKRKTYKSFTEMIKLLKFKSLLGEDEMKIFKKILTKQKGGHGYELGN